MTINNQDKDECTENGKIERIGKKEWRQPELKEFSVNDNTGYSAGTGTDMLGMS